MAENGLSAAELMAENLAQHYRDLYEEACELLNNGHQQAAVDIAMDILSHSDVGPYRRAVVNLFVSTNAEFFTVNQADYAIECLNILVKLQETMTATELERPENSSAVGFINFARDIEAPIKLLEQQATARLHEIYAMCLEEEKKEMNAEEKTETDIHSGDGTAVDEAAQSTNTGAIVTVNVDALQQQFEMLGTSSSSTNPESPTSFPTTDDDD